MVSNLLHQLEDAGQRRTKHIDSEEVLLPRGDGGFHKDLLDVGHGSADVLRGKPEGERKHVVSGKPLSGIQ